MLQDPLQRIQESIYRRLPMLCHVELHPCCAENRSLDPDSDSEAIVTYAPGCLFRTASLWKTWETQSIRFLTFSVLHPYSTLNLSVRPLNRYLLDDQANHTRNDRKPPSMQAKHTQVE